eukprot:jgi/Astpho2/3989/Aster-x0183
MQISWQVLTLPGNHISGTLPYLMGQMPILNYLAVPGNSLTGVVPASIFSMQYLIGFLASDNYITGTLPSSLLGMPRLKYILLANNRLAGPIPKDWFQLAQLEILELSDNQLSGTLPAPAEAAQPQVETLLALQSGGKILQDVRVRNNLLTGTIPASIARIPLQGLDLRGNFLNGTIPTAVMGMPWMTWLYLGANPSLAGTLPPMALYNLEELEIESTNLSGTLPATIGYSRSLSRLTLSNTKISGPIPDTMSQMSELTYIDLVETNMVGTVPEGYALPTLPSWLSLDPSLGYSSVSDPDTNVVCPTIVASKDLLPSLAWVRLDPMYFSSRGCKCLPGYTKASTNSANYKCVPVVTPFVHKKVAWAGVVLPVLVAMLVAMLMAYHVLRTLRPGLQQDALAQAAAKKANSITLVLVDIEGTDELCRWNQMALVPAIAMHHKTLRGLLGKYRGAEVYAEADALLLSFQEPADAVAWCLASQQALISCNWPVALQLHPLTTTRTLGSLNQYLLFALKDACSGARAVGHGWLCGMAK